MEISDQVHKIREIGKAISRLENCMQFYRGDAICFDKYGDEYDFSFGLDFFTDYDENSTLELHGPPKFVPARDQIGDYWENDEEPIGDITSLEILFHYV